MRQRTQHQVMEQSPPRYEGGTASKHSWEVVPASKATVAVTLLLSGSMVWAALDAAAAAAAVLEKYPHPVEEAACVATRRWQLLVLIKLAAGSCWGGGWVAQSSSSSLNPRGCRAVVHKRPQ